MNQYPIPQATTGATFQKDNIGAILLQEIMATGAVAAGFSKAGNVDGEVMHQYDGWVAGGYHAGMDYLKRHSPLKENPRAVLEDVSTIVSIAFSYAPSVWRDGNLPSISAYAYGDDYHDVLRRRLNPVVERMKSQYGGNWRICIDSAPLAERYWAVKSGIGRRGINGSVIIDGFGSYIFLAEILTSLRIEGNDTARLSTGKDANLKISGTDTGLCLQCGKCTQACPSGALLGNGTLDSRRCLNYLTIEHRGEWKGEGLEAMHTESGRHTLYGCDICQRVCPHNEGIPSTGIEEFSPRNYISSEWRLEDFMTNISPQDFSRMFKGSPIKRTKFEGFMRNASNIKGLGQQK